MIVVNRKLARKSLQSAFVKPETTGYWIATHVDNPLDPAPDQEIQKGINGQTFVSRRVYSGSTLRPRGELLPIAVHGKVSIFMIDVVKKFVNWVMDKACDNLVQIPLDCWSNPLDDSISRESGSDRPRFLINFHNKLHEFELLDLLHK